MEICLLILILILQHLQSFTLVLPYHLLSFGKIKPLIKLIMHLKQSFLPIFPYKHSLSFC